MKCEKSKHFELWNDLFIQSSNPSRCHPILKFGKRTTSGIAWKSQRLYFPHQKSTSINYSISATNAHIFQLGQKLYNRQSPGVVQVAKNKESMVQQQISFLFVCYVLTICNIADLPEMNLLCSGVFWWIVLICLLPFLWWIFSSVISAEC